MAAGLCWRAVSRAARATEHAECPAPFPARAHSHAAEEHASRSPRPPRPPGCLVEDSATAGAGCCHEGAPQAVGEARPFWALGMCLRGHFRIWELRPQERGRRVPARLSTQNRFPADRGADPFSAHGKGCTRAFATCHLVRHG